MQEGVMDTVKATRQKTEAFVESLDDNLKGPVSIMGLGMMAGQMLGEFAAKQGLPEHQLDDLIDRFCQAFRKSTLEYYQGKKPDGS